MPIDDVFIFIFYLVILHFEILRYFSLVIVDDTDPGQSTCRPYHAFFT